MSAYTIPGQPYPIFPTLSGRGWSVKRTPNWKTLTQETFSGLDSQAGCMAYPWWQWELTYELLRSDSANNEFQTLVGFYNQQKGAAIPFCFLDSVDNAATNQTFGTGDGISTQFQLFRTFGNVYEPVLAPYGGVTVYKGGTMLTPTTDFTVSNLGLVTFTVAPVLGAALTWTGTFYWICRFLDDQIEFENFMNNYWMCKKILFKSKKLYSLGTTA